MRFVLSAVLCVAVALGLAAGSFAAAPKTPKPVDIKKEILETCGSIPYGPTLVMDAKSATKDEMENAKADVVAFIAQADIYQECLAKLEIKLADRLSVNDRRLIAAAANRAQQEKEALGNDYNKLVDAYNKLHS